MKYSRSATSSFWQRSSGRPQIWWPASSNTPMREMAGTSAVPASTSAHSAWRSMPAGQLALELRVVSPSAIRRARTPRPRCRPAAGSGWRRAPRRARIASARLRHSDTGPDRADSSTNSRPAADTCSRNAAPRPPSCLAEHRLRAHRDKVDRQRRGTHTRLRTPQRGGIGGHAGLFEPVGGLVGRSPDNTHPRRSSPGTRRRRARPKPFHAPRLPARPPLAAVRPRARRRVLCARPPNRLPHAAPGWPGWLTPAMDLPAHGGMHAPPSCAAR